MVSPHPQPRHLVVTPAAAAAAASAGSGLPAPPEGHESRGEDDEDGRPDGRADDPRRRPVRRDGGALLQELVASDIRRRVLAAAPPHIEGEILGKRVQGVREGREGWVGIAFSRAFDFGICGVGGKSPATKPKRSPLLREMGVVT